MKPKNKTDIIKYVYRDPQGRKVELSDGTLEHIKGRHPEVKIDLVKATVTSPAFIMENPDRDALGYSTIMGTGLYFNVYAGVTSDTQQCKIRTAHIATKIPKGDCIWHRPKK